MFNIAEYLKILKRTCINTRITDKKLFELLFDPIIEGLNIKGKNDELLFFEKTVRSEILHNKRNVHSSIQSALERCNSYQVIEDNFSYLIDNILDPNIIDNAIEQIKEIISKDTSINSQQKKIIETSDAVCFLSHAFILALKMNNIMTNSDDIVLWHNGNNILDAIYGDIFTYGFDNRKNQNIIVIPVDTSFETHISGINEKSQYPLVSENTLHGMWLSRIEKCGYSEEDIKTQVKESLIQRRISPLNSSDSSTIEHYPIGTIAQFSHTKNCFYLIAISEFNEQNIAYSNKDKIKFCLQKLIEHYNIYGQGYHLYIPLLGTGRSRANLSFQDSFDLILDTFMKHKRLLQGEISIVIQPNIKDLKIIMEEC